MRLCMSIGCRCVATHAIKMIVPDAVRDEAAAEGLLGIEMCSECALAAEEGGIEPIPPIVAALADVLRFPGAVPDVDEAYLTAIPLGSPEHLAFKSLEATAH